MTALEELRAGHLGDAFVKLLYKQMAVAARRGQFPPPADHPSWNADAVVETAHNFLTESENYPRLTEIAARVEDDDGLRRYLVTTLTNYLREQGRKTTVGKLVRRLRDRLNEDPRFEWVPDAVPGAGNVTLAGAETAPYAGSADPLVDATRAVEINVVRWSANAKREGPLADTPSLLDMCQAALIAAGASLSVPALAQVIAPRLGIDPYAVPAAIPVDDLGAFIADETDPATADGVGRSLPAEVAEAVSVILSELSERETLVLAVLHETVRDIADQTGLAVSTAGAVKQRVQAKVFTILRSYSESEAEQIAFASRDAARRQVGFDPI